MTDASTPNSVRVSIQPKDGGSLADAATIIEASGGKVLGVGTHRDPGHSRRGFFFRIRGLDAASAAIALRKSGYTVY